MRLILTLLFAGLGAGALVAQDAEPKKQVPTRQATLITAAEIGPIRHEMPTAYELIQRLRPQFLRSRGTTSLGGSAGSSKPTALVVVDGSPRGDLSALRQVSAMSIEEIRYLSAADASIRFGTGYTGGAILVTTRSR